MLFNKFYMENKKLSFIFFLLNTVNILAIHLYLLIGLEWFSIWVKMGEIYRISINSTSKYSLTQKYFSVIQELQHVLVLLPDIFLRYHCTKDFHSLYLHSLIIFKKTSNLKLTQTEGYYFSCVNFPNVTENSLLHTHTRTRLFI